MHTFSVSLYASAWIFWQPLSSIYDSLYPSFHIINDQYPNIQTEVPRAYLTAYSKLWFFWEGLTPKPHTVIYREKNTCFRDIDSPTLSVQFTLNSIPSISCVSHTPLPPPPPPTPTASKLPPHSCHHPDIEGQWNRNQMQALLSHCKTLGKRDDRPLSAIRPESSGPRAICTRELARLLLMASACEFATMPKDYCHCCLVPPMLPRGPPCRCFDTRCITAAFWRLYEKEPRVDLYCQEVKNSIIPKDSLRLIHFAQKMENTVKVNVSVAKPKTKYSIL